jgi:adenine-specific DNA-methyltransferase
MPRGRKKADSEKKVETYTYPDSKRRNNPPVGLVSSATDPLNGRTRYQHDPHIDPFLSWAGKAEGMSFDVQNVSLHVHERIEPRRIINSFLKGREKKKEQLFLFEDPDNDPPLSKAVDFYKHDQDWTNRLIAGDSLLVMNSLLKKEGMAGKVQMIYMDPPYGIDYKSNFQPFLSKQDVKDQDKDIPAEPEMIQAFRDTWKLDSHSYLSYLRDRLFLIKELLALSGSCFVQISDKNVGYLKIIMDEVFGSENFICIIRYRTRTMSLQTSLLNVAYDHIIWYAKQKSKIKYYQLFLNQEIQDDPNYKYVELVNGERRLLTDEEKSDHSSLKGSKIYRLHYLKPTQYRKNQDFNFLFKGELFSPPGGDISRTPDGIHSWATTPTGMEELVKRNRIQKSGKTLEYILYYDDYPVTPLHSVWNDTAAPPVKLYAVQTSDEVIKRCLLMTTDPGDLVFDPTCGSGTTASVAERWGRRWITCDTSRVAITLAKQRLMRDKYDYYELAYPNEGVRSGFKYKTVPHITLGSIANNEPAKEETLYDQPFIEKGKIRVTGPFTVEAVPCLRINPFDRAGNDPMITGGQLARSGETGKQTEWRDELKATGIRSIGGKKIEFSRVEPMIATRFLHAEGEVQEADGTTKLAYISFGPDFGPLEQRQVEMAVQEARSLKNKAEFLIFAAFHFDPEAAKDIDEIAKTDLKTIKHVFKTQMSVDLLTKDLRKGRSSNQSFWLIGQPEVSVKPLKDGKYKVKVSGFDYYNPVSGEIESGGTSQIAMWFLDTDYDERSLYPDQVFFPEGDPKRDWSRLAKALNSDVNEDLLEKFSGVESLPFTAGENKKIAVKIIDNRGIESFVIKKLE